MAVSGAAVFGIGLQVIRMDWYPTPNGFLSFLSDPPGTPMITVYLLAFLGLLLAFLGGIELYQRVSRARPEVTELIPAVGLLAALAIAALSITPWVSSGAGKMAGSSVTVSTFSKHLGVADGYLTFLLAAAAVIAWLFVTSGRGVLYGAITWAASGLGDIRHRDAGDPRSVANQSHRL